MLVFASSTNVWFKNRRFYSVTPYASSASHRSHHLLAAWLAGRFTRIPGMQICNDRKYPIVDLHINPLIFTVIRQPAVIFSASPRCDFCIDPTIFRSVWMDKHIEAFKTGKYPSVQRVFGEFCASLVMDLRMLSESFFAILP